MKPDTDLQAAVMQELALDPHIDESAIGVSVRHGIVTLDGVVGAYAERVAAETAAHRVTGVHDVANDIEVKPSWKTDPTDSEIAEAVRIALAASAYIPHEQIQCTVSQRGHVTLTGTVSTLQQRDDAEAAVRVLDGVAVVTNQLAVEVPATSQLALRHQIEYALERHLARDLARIAIDIQGETIILTGTVDSPAERRAVVGAVKGTPGVRRIDDRLHVATPAS